MGSVAKRVLTGASLALAVVSLLVLDGYSREGLVPWGVASALSLLCAWELGRMGSFRTLQLNPSLYFAGVLVAIAAWFGRDELSSPEQPYLVLLAGAAVVVVVTLLGRRKARKPALWLGLWALVPLFGLISVDASFGAWGLGCLVILSKVGDIFGYFVGRAIGKRKPFKTLSPNKTVAGCVASLMAGILVGAALGYAGELPGSEAGIVVGALIGASINLASQAGDLLESYVKRRATVKDSSALAGAAGGVLDVVDSLLLSIPLALCSWPWLL